MSAVNFRRERMGLPITLVLTETQDVHFRARCDAQQITMTEVLRNLIAAWLAE